MSSEKLFNKFLERNAAASSTYRAPYRISDMKEFPQAAGKGIFICTVLPKPGLLTMLSVLNETCVTVGCADARADPTHIFNLRRGEAHLIRNAGGRAYDDVFRTFEIMSSIAPPGLIIVLHHTDCGALNTTDAEVKSKMLERAPGAKTRDWWGTFKDIGIDESVRQDVAAIRQWKFLPSNTKVASYVYEVETGTVREVVSLKSDEKAHL